MFLFSCILLFVCNRSGDHSTANQLSQFSFSVSHAIYYNFIFSFHVLFYHTMF